MHVAVEAGAGQLHKALAHSAQCANSLPCQRPAPGDHSGPWHVLQAIRGSKYYTKDLTEADVVFVNDYCHVLWWLAHVHTYGQLQVELIVLFLWPCVSFWVDVAHSD